MESEKKTLIITIVLGILDMLVSNYAAFTLNNMWLIVSAMISVILVVVLVLLYNDYSKIKDTYDFIKYMFFGSDYNGFNFFPKLKIFMDYLNVYNNVEIDSIKFECFSDNNMKRSNITWIMNNVYNPTKEEIKSYSLYSTSNFSVVDGVDVSVRIGGKHLKIDTDNIKTKNGIQETPFTFVESIKPGGQIPQIKIKMGMKDGMDFSRPEIIIVYPRNYGKKVGHIEIVYKTKGIAPLSVKLHEIKKERNGYVDRSIKSCVPNEENGVTHYMFTLNKNEIKMDNLYYLFITSKEQG